jgi:hypothetical protein
MTREQALPYVSFAVDDAMSERDATNVPPYARLVGWQCGFEPLFVAVWSYLSDKPLDVAEAEELAADYLLERKWFSGDDATPADYVI